MDKKTHIHIKYNFIKEIVAKKEVNTKYFVLSFWEINLIICD